MFCTPPLFSLLDPSSFLSLRFVATFSYVLGSLFSDTVFFFSTPPRNASKVLETPYIGLPRSFYLRNCFVFFPCLTFSLWSLFPRPRGPCGQSWDKSFLFPFVPLRQLLAVQHDQFFPSLVPPSSSSLSIASDSPPPFPPVPTRCRAFLVAPPGFALSFYLSFLFFLLLHRRWIMAGKILSLPSFCAHSRCCPTASLFSLYMRFNRILVRFALLSFLFRSVLSGSFSLSGLSAESADSLHGASSFFHPTDFDSLVRVRLILLRGKVLTRIFFFPSFLACQAPAAPLTQLAGRKGRPRLIPLSCCPLTCGSVLMPFCPVSLCLFFFKRAHSVNGSVALSSVLLGGFSFFDPIFPSRSTTP